MAINYQINMLRKSYRFKNSTCLFTVLVLLLLGVQAKAAHYDILAFGDSITQGVKIDSDGNKTGILSPPAGARTSDGYEPELELLAADIPDTVYVYNWGYGGERTNVGLDRIDSTLASRRAQYILIMEGTNDILAGISTATTVFNLSQMIVKSRKAFVEPILATVTPCTISEAWAADRNNIIANDLNVKIRQLAINKNVVLADQYNNLSPPPNGTGWETIYNSGDGLHLSDEGERRVAKTWFDSLLVSTYAQFQQDLGNQGIVSIEAEHFNANTPYSNQNWISNVTAGSSGNEAMEAAPNSKVSVTANYAPNNSPRLDFDVNFVKTGTHYVWVRGYGPDLGSDSIHIGLDDRAVPSAGSMKSFSPNKSWIWCGDAEGTGVLAPATINIVSTGIHTINAWMREDGFIFDKIVITTDPNYVPTNIGPGESPYFDSGSSGLYAPRVLSIAPDSAAVNSVYLYDVNASGSPEPSFVLTNGPAGMVINPVTGVLSWTPNAAGTYFVTVVAQNTIGSDSQSFIITVPDQSTLPTDAQFQQDLGNWGIVSIEAEHFNANTPYSGHNWISNVTAGSSGNGAMKAAPNSKVSVTANYAPNNSPRLDFDVNFVKTGTHYVWVRGYGPDLGSDSIHIGLDDRAVPSAGSMKSFSPNKSWIWCGDAEGTGVLAPATINIASTGIHTINAWMREDGFIFDKIVITTDPNYVPTNIGPGESPYFDSGSSGLYAPRVLSIAPDSVAVNSLFQYDVNASGSPEPSFVLANGPAGMVINTATGVLSWTPDSVGTYFVTVIAQNTIGSDSQSFTITVLDQSSLPTDAQFQQDLGNRGIVSIEAEHFNAKTPYSTHSWISNVTAGSSGNGAMKATPNSKVSVTANYAPNNSPRLDFDVNFVKTGTHYVWVRGYGPDLGSDSIHIGLDDRAVPSAGSMKSFSPNKSWIWCGDAEGTGVLAPATINIVSTGIHTINAWMREDGFIFDKIVITTDPDYVPTNIGPGESPYFDSGYLGLYGPQIISIAPNSVIVNSVYQYDVDASGSPEPSFVLANGPAGMVINPATGELSWTPYLVGTYSVTVIAQNSIGSDSQSFVITVLGQPPLPSGLVSYWTLDETGGSVFRDETGLNDGTCTSNCPDPTAGLVDGGQYFNGTRSINVASESSLDWQLGESFSLEFWMHKSTVTFENEPVIDRYDKSTNAHWWAGIGHAVGPDKARFYVRDRAGMAFSVSGSTILTDGNWHHVVAVQDAVMSQLRIYVDGVLEGTTSTLFSSDFVMPSTPVTIGQVALTDSVTVEFIGRLDEVAVYNRTMSLNEILAHFNNGYLGLGYFETP